MFFHIFRNTFITTDNIPAEIKTNYKVESIEFSSIDPIVILDELAKLHREEIIFYIIKDPMVYNGIIKQFFLCMGLDYKAYKIMIDGYKLYIRTVVRVYEPKYKEDLVELEERDFSMRGQTIPWNYGIIPIEYWINHISNDNNYIQAKRNTDSYAYHLYTTMNIEYNKIQDRLDKLCNITPKFYKTLKEFIDDPYNNGAFNSEFDCFYFNKRLMKYLQEIHFILRGINSDIDEKDIEEYNKNHRWEHVNYDNKSIY